MGYVKGRLTFSNVVALIALFVSLGGGVYAASKINGKVIKKTSIAGKKLKPDTLTGAQINESALGTVPSANSAGTAASADSAKTAQDAQTLAGSGPGAFVSSGDIKRIRFDATTATTTPIQETVLQLGPLTMKASCAKNDFHLTASTSATGAGWDIGYVRYNGLSDTYSPRSDGGGLGSAAVDLFDGSITANNTVRFVGNFLYNDATTTISVPFVVFLDNPNPGNIRCFATGTATRATG